MEGKEVYKKSYENLSKLARRCTTDNIVINLNDFDQDTRAAILKALTTTVNVRIKEVYQIISSQNNF